MAITRRKGSRHHTWTDADYALLGTMTDKEVAKKLNISATSVAAMRWRRGMPAHRHDNYVSLSAEAQADIATLRLVYERKMVDAGINIGHLPDWQVVAITLADAVKRLDN